MRRVHVATAVRARPAGRRTDLVDELRLQARDVRPSKLAVDPGIAGTTGDEVVDHRRDRGLAAEALIEGLTHFGVPPPPGRRPAEEGPRSATQRQISAYARVQVPSRCLRLTR